MQLNYKTLGTGSPVIILHGLFGMLDNWSSFAKNLADSHEVILVDQRNHGRSFHSEDFDYQLLASDLNTFIAQMNLEKPAIIGHSMGGKTAMQLDLSYPGLIQQLIVVDIGPKTYRPSHLDIFDAILSIDLSKYASRQEVDDVLAKHIENQAVRLFLLKNLCRGTENDFSWKANFKALYANYPKILGNIEDHGISSTTPSLFIRGTKSPYLESTDLAHIRQLFPDSNLEGINAGHWIHAEKPGELLKTITSFLHYS